MEVEKVLFMNGGDGETSYAKNSIIQKVIIEATKSVMEEALLDLYCSAFPNKLSLADLGCSAGPNTLSVVGDAVNTIEERCWKLGKSPPEFMLFLNDLPGNDFNSVFRSLQGFYEERERLGKGREISRCFVAGVPGSFYGRLFQSRSIDFFHSSTSLHWLSQDPLKLQGHDVLVNKRNIYLSKQSPPSVVDAYSMQFQKKFLDFLKFRSEEMALGGQMVLVLAGRKTIDPTSEEVTFHWNLLTQALMDMIQEDYIAEENLDSFNLPYYFPCAMELISEIQREGSFSLKCLKIFDVPWDACQSDAYHIEGNDFLSKTMTKGQSMANCIRAAVESILASHFGSDIIEGTFSRYSEALEDYLSRKKPMLTNMLVSLVRES